jgi:hypothetical protein
MHLAALPGALPVPHSALAARHAVARALAPAAPRLVRASRRSAMAAHAAAAAFEPFAPFEFASAGRIVFGRGEALKRVPAAAKAMGGTVALIVVGSSTARAQPFADALNALGVKHAFFSIGAFLARRWRRAVPALIRSAQR